MMSYESCYHNRYSSEFRFVLPTSENLASVSLIDVALIFAIHNKFDSRYSLLVTAQTPGASFYAIT